MTRRQRACEAGFTSIELMITIAIMGVLALAITPILGNALLVGRARGAAEQVAAAIQQTRATAISQSCTYQVTFPGNNAYWIEPENVANNCVGGAPTEGPAALIHNATVALQGGITEFAFTATGTSTGGTILVNSGTPEQRTVTVTLAGRIQVTP